MDADQQAAGTPVWKYAYRGFCLLVAVLALALLVIDVFDFDGISPVQAQTISGEDIALVVLLLLAPIVGFAERIEFNKDGVALDMRKAAEVKQSAQDAVTDVKAGEQAIRPPPPRGRA